MYFPNAASGNEWNRMATLSIRFYSLHPWVHCALYKFVIFEIFVVEKNIRNLSNIIITQDSYDEKGAEHFIYIMCIEATLK